MKMNIILAFDNQDLIFGTVIPLIVSDNLQQSTVVKNQAMLIYVYMPIHCFCLFIAATVFLGE